MKRMILKSGRAFLFLISCLILLVWLQEWSYAGEDDSKLENSNTVFIDRSDDQLLYGAQVAALNRQAERTTQIKGLASQKTETDFIAVLVRSDGAEIDFSPFEPRYVVAGPYDCYTLYFDSEAAADQAVRELENRPGIRYAERDGAVMACGENEHSFHSWGAQEMNFGAYLDYSLQWGNGSTTVAIVDSGVFLHSQLSGRIRASGYDYVDGDDDATNDLFGHGTNVAGIVADCTAGEPVYLFPIRVLNASGGGSISNVANAVREATEKGVDVINLSLESVAISAALDEAILDAISAGITVVAAAGNKAIDTALVSPAHLTNSGVIVVGSAERDGGRSSYSNFGESVDVYAYGTGISCCSRSGGYTTATGTSMSAPHISGIAAMLQLIHPGMSPGRIEERIVHAAYSEEGMMVPDLLLMIPERFGFRLSQLRLDLGKTIQLPETALPETAMESIAYQSSDETVLQIEAGRLIPIKTGTATVTASCTGFEPASFQVCVECETVNRLTMPQGVLRIEEEAFRGNKTIVYAELGDEVQELGDNVFAECDGLKMVFLPASLVSIGDNTFSGAVVVCAEGSEADRFAQENNLDYLIEER